MFEHGRKSWALLLLGLSALLISACQGEFSLPAAELQALSEASEIELSFDREGLDEIEFFGAVDSQQTDLWRIGGRDVQITPSTEVKGPIGIGDLVKVHARPGPEGDLVAREIELASADDLIDEDEHDLDDDRDEVKFWGIVQEIGEREWRIDGRIVRVMSETEIDSDIKVGDFVKVEAAQSGADALVALEIESTDADHEADDDRDHDDDEDHDEEDHDQDDEHADDQDEDHDDDHDHDKED